MTTIQWYPGHMVKAQKKIKEKFRLVDCLIHLLDARAPISSRNPLFEELDVRRPVLYVLNKEDLADPKVTSVWKTHLETEGAMVLALQGNDPNAWKKIHQRIKKHPALKSKAQVNLMIIGVPNVGKSTLINRWVGKKVAKTGDRPAITQEVRWLRGRGGVAFLDTPGILWPKFEEPTIGYHLAITGAIRPEILSTIDLAFYLVEHLVKHYPKSFAERFKIEKWDKENLINLESICKSRGLVLKGGGLDHDRASELLLREFQTGLIGRISLDRPKETQSDS